MRSQMAMFHPHSWMPEGGGNTVPAIRRLWWKWPGNGFGGSGRGSRAPSRWLSVTEPPASWWLRKVDDLSVSIRRWLWRSCVRLVVGAGRAGDGIAYTRKEECGGRARSFLFIFWLHYINQCPTGAPTVSYRALTAAAGGHVVLF